MYSTEVFRTTKAIAALVALVAFIAIGMSSGNATSGPVLVEARTPSPSQCRVAALKPKFSSSGLWKGRAASGYGLKKCGGLPATTTAVVTLVAEDPGPNNDVILGGNDVVWPFIAGDGEHYNPPRPCNEDSGVDEIYSRITWHVGSRTLDRRSPTVRVRCS